MQMTKDVNQYFLEGCGRCEKGGTPDCKVHAWDKVLKALRQILNATELKEECKWGAPAYTYKRKNILMLSAFNDNCRIGFFKGALLKDPEGVLVSPGKNSNESRELRYTTVKKVKEQKGVILSYVAEAIEIEKAGKVVPKKSADDFEMPEELLQALEANPALAEAYEQLTPGRKKSYLIHVGSAKQSKTRASRVEKCVPKILAGKGFLDR